MVDPEALSNEDLRLMGGEMTAQECRTARAFIRLANAKAADEIERLRAALERIASTDPDDTSVFHDIANTALSNDKGAD